MHGRELRLRHPANRRTEPDYLARRHAFEARPVRLWFDDDKIIPAVRKIDLQSSEARNFKFDVRRVQVAVDVEQANLFDKMPFPLVLDGDSSRWRLDCE